MKKSFFLLIFCVFFLASCKKDKALITTPIIPTTTAVKGMQANISKAGMAKRSWRTVPSSAAADSATPGVDYYAVRGAMNPNELTLFSFGRYTDDTSSVAGRITIFLSSVNDTGSYMLGGSSTGNAQITLVDGATIEHYATDRLDNVGTVYVSEYDTLNSIISGSFKFQAISGSSVVRVDSGAFYRVPFRN